MPVRRSGRSPVLSRWSATVVLTLVVVVAACDATDGRTLPPPDPATSVPPATPVPEPVVEAFTLSSPAVDEAGQLAPDHGCHGAGTPPPLAWSGTPAAAALGLVARQQDEAGTVLWVVGGIDPAVVGVEAGGQPEGAVHALNAAGTVGWLPPCPGPGEQVAVAVVLHALPEPVALAPDTPADVAAALIEGASTEQAALVVTLG